MSAPRATISPHRAVRTRCRFRSTRSRRSTSSPSRCSLRSRGVKRRGRRTGSRFMNRTARSCPACAVPRARRPASPRDPPCPTSRPQSSTPPPERLRGTRPRASLRIFKGIPFAAGAGRPAPLAGAGAAARWDGVRDAAEFGPACVAAATAIVEHLCRRRPLPMSEDCLTLNIWAPKNAKNAPVFFWIYGGALTTRREPRADVRRAQARRSAAWWCVVDQLPRRRARLAGPSRAERRARAGISGNYGLLDQIRALEWVQRQYRRRSAATAAMSRSQASPPAR